MGVTTLGVLGGLAILPELSPALASFEEDHFGHFGKPQLREHRLEMGEELHTRMQEERHEHWEEMGLTEEEIAEREARREERRLERCERWDK